MDERPPQNDQADFLTRALKEKEQKKDKLEKKKPLTEEFKSKLDPETFKDLTEPLLGQKGDDGRGGR